MSSTLLLLKILQSVKVSKVLCLEASHFDKKVIRIFFGRSSVLVYLLYDHVRLHMVRGLCC